MYVTSFVDVAHLFFLIFIIIIFFYFTILYWFCHTSTCICHGCTRVPHPESPSHLPPHTIPLVRCRIQEAWGFSCFRCKVMVFIWDFLFPKIRLYCYELLLKTAFAVSHRFWIIVVHCPLVLVFFDFLFDFIGYLVTDYLPFMCFWFLQFSYNWLPISDF